MIKLDDTVPIAVFDPWSTVNQHLLTLLKDFDADDWAKPTVHANRNVKDLTAHLLHGSLRWVTGIRDNYRPKTDAISGLDDLIDFIQNDNSAFMVGMQRISPEIIIEMIAHYGPIEIEPRSLWVQRLRGLVSPEPVRHGQRTGSTWPANIPKSGITSSSFETRQSANRSMRRRFLSLF